MGIEEKECECRTIKGSCRFGGERRGEREGERGKGRGEGEEDGYDGYDNEEDYLFDEDGNFDYSRLDTEQRDNLRRVFGDDEYSDEEEEEEEEEEKEGDKSKNKDTRKMKVKSVYGQ